jgi:hypothetical protein
MIIWVTGQGGCGWQTISFGHPTATDGHQASFREIVEKMVSVSAAVTAKPDQSDSKGCARFMRHRCRALYRPDRDGSIWLMAISHRLD